MELLQAILDILGIVPVIGESADLLNASIYTANGDYTNAAISAASTVPIAGWGATATKFAGKVATPTVIKKLLLKQTTYSQTKARLKTGQGNN